MLDLLGDGVLHRNDLVVAGLRLRDNRRLVVRTAVVAAEPVLIHGLCPVRSIVPAVPADEADNTVLVMRVELCA